MNRTGKRILKIFLIMLCAFILFEICGAVVNIIAVRSQHKKVIEIVENNGGDVWDIYSCTEYMDNTHYPYTLAIVCLEDTDKIYSEFEKEFNSYGGVQIYSLEYMEQNAHIKSVYSRYWDKIDFETNYNKENYYVISVFNAAVPFKHNIITYLTDFTTIG